MSSFVKPVAITRRAMFLGSAVSGLMLGAGAARSGAEIVDLDWGDLVPDPEMGQLMEVLREQGVIFHGELSTAFDQEEAEAVTEAFNGQRVRIPGFIVPLDLSGDAVTMFILAPFVGACIHVPPPPANQLILVSTPTPYAYDGLYEPVYVTGVFSTAVSTTPLADIGYTMAADLISPYEAG